MKSRVRHRVQPGVKHIARTIPGRVDGPDGRSRQSGFGHILTTAWCGADKFITPGTIIILAPRFATCATCKLKRADHIREATP